MADDKSQNSNDFILLSKFHEQFAQNQNHHQNLFIKFLSAVFVVITAYFIVYVKTQSYANWHNVTYNYENAEILSYAVWHLVGAFFISQTIFIIMSMIVLNMGYNFRRDQKVNSNIRKEYVEVSKYEKIFGSKAFNVDKLKFWDYQPGFHFIFYFSLFFIQSLLFISILIKANSIEGLLEWPRIIYYSIPLIITLIIYPYYFYKFKIKVKNSN